jgi:membrane associated rhomboid family serine protease
MANNRGFGGGFFNSVLPPVLKYILLINVAIFVLQVFFLDYITIGGVSVGRLIIEYFALQPIFNGTYGVFGGSNFWVWQLITYQFLHGGLWHLFFNMFALWMFGMELENQWGSTRFLIYYLLSGIGAGICQLFISPLFGPVGPTIGASGAIYGVLLAFGMTFPNRPIFMFPFFIPIPAKFFVIIFAGIELFSGISGGDGVAHFAHLGGALTGLLLILFGDKTKLMPFLIKLFSPRKRHSNAVNDFYSQSPRQQKQDPSYFNVSWQKPEQKPTQKRYFEVEEESKPSSRNSPSVIIEGEEITQRKIDEILDKISLQGYQSLTEKEKRILTELSKRL